MTNSLRKLMGPQCMYFRLFEQPWNSKSTADLLPFLISGLKCDDWGKLIQRKE